MNERQPNTTPTEALVNTEEAELQAEQEQRYKTLAVRLEESTHARLRFLAQLSGSSIAEEIRGAIDARIAAAQDDPELVARADHVREEMEREATARAAALAGFLGTSAVAATTSSPASAGRGSTAKPRRGSKTRTEQAQ